MSEMVERVAKAICRSDGRDPDSVVYEASPSYPRPYLAWDDYLTNARAAIEAMREPTEAMEIAARDWSYGKYGKPIGNDASNGCFRSMIDGALRD